MLSASPQSSVEALCASVPLRYAYETVRCHNPERKTSISFSCSWMQFAIAGAKPIFTTLKNVLISRRVDNRKVMVYR